MRLIDEPVEVISRSGRPVSFRRRGRIYNIIQVVDTWRYAGRWWAEEGTWIFLTVQTDGDGLFELCYDTGAEQWRLYRAYD